MDTKEILKIIPASTWSFAKSMPTIPHEYIVRNRVANDELFSAFVNLIRDKGYTKMFGNKEYKYLNVNGLRYWTMGSPVEETTIINRAKNEFMAYFDSIAYKYDSLYEDERYQDENEKIRLGLLNSYEGKGVLDIGCGTGLFLDLVSEDQLKHYIGIDISRNMLTVLSKKHRGRKNTQIFATPLSQFVNIEDKPIDYVISLFGSASYLTKDELKRIALLYINNKIESFYFMFYKTGYQPTYHDEINDHILTHLDGSFGDEFGDFITIDNIEDLQQVIQEL